MSHITEYPHRIFISFPSSNKNSLQIPVPPETIAGGTGSIISTYNLITIGEVLAQGGVKLERVKWESHFPKIYDPTISVISSAQHLNPLVWRDAFVAMQRRQAFINVAIANTPIDMRMGILNFKWAFVPGPSGDIWYQLDLIEDKQGQIREFTGIKFPEKSNREPPSTVEEGFDSFPDPQGTYDFYEGMGQRLYTLRQGDTLYGLAWRFYGDASFYINILDANRALLMGNVVTLRIPPAISPAEELPLSEERQRAAGLIVTEYRGGVLPDNWVIDQALLKPDSVLPIVIIIPERGAPLHRGTGQNEE